MIGWILAGAWLGLEHREAQRRKLARKEARAKRRREAPMPVWVWVVYGILAVAAFASPAALPGMAIVGVLLFVYDRRRRRKHEEWKAQQERDRLTADADAAEAGGMPLSAAALRKARDIR